MLKKPPMVRDNNGALQVRLRLDGWDHFINRIGRFEDPISKPGDKPSELRSGGMPNREIWICP